MGSRFVKLGIIFISFSAVFTMVQNSQAAELCCKTIVDGQLYCGKSFCRLPNETKASRNNYCCDGNAYKNGKLICELRACGEPMRTPPDSMPLENCHYGKKYDSYYSWSWYCDPHASPQLRCHYSSSQREYVCDEINESSSGGSHELARDKR